MEAIAVRLESGEITVIFRHFENRSLRHEHTIDMDMRQYPILQKMVEALIEYVKEAASVPEIG